MVTYIIEWKLTDGYEVSRSVFLSEEAVKDKMAKNPEWTYRIVEMTPQCIKWEAK